MYEHGRGIARDHTSAAAWFRREAEQGDAEAPVKLAHKYAEGEGVPRDAVQALAWIVPVVLRDDFGAKEILEDIRMFLTEDQMRASNNQGVVRFWWLESAVLRHVGKGFGRQTGV